MLWAWLNYFGVTIAIWVVIWSGLKTFQANPPTEMLRVWLQLIIYYARYLMLWLIVYLLVHLWLINTQSLYWILLIFSLIYVYSSWIEPNRLSIQQQNIQLGMNGKPIKIAVLSDIHVGIFSGKPRQLNTIVRHLNDLSVDAVLIAGDWLYHAGADIVGQMLVFKALNKPCYTVFSEQDLEQDQQLAENLTRILTTLGIKPINDESVAIAGVNVVGVGAKMTMPLTQMIKDDKPLILLTHDIKQIEANPSNLADKQMNKLIIAGQTHGGQVNIPFVTQAIVQAMTGTKYLSGLRQQSTYQVWITTGTGMSGLPFRFNCPPKIDVLTIC